tara:strand:- start:265 stop:546 length:282 start_codon:yes stop_codon:yes gene_type:complete
MSKKKVTGNEHLLKISLLCIALGAGLSYSLTLDVGYIISRAIFSIIFWFIGLGVFLNWLTGDKSKLIVYDEYIWTVLAWVFFAVFITLMIIAY